MQDILSQSINQSTNRGTVWMCWCRSFRSFFTVAGDTEAANKSVSEFAPSVDASRQTGRDLQSGVRDSSSTSLNQGARPFTPEIVDDRPVWTVNAPVSGVLHSKSLPGSPSPDRRRVANGRFREILREETIITDTTISEVTDSNVSTSYILNSPRTPRHLARDLEVW